MTAIIVMVIGLVGIWLILRNLGVGSNSSAPNLSTGTTSVISVRPSEYPDYNALKDMHSLTLIQNAIDLKNNKTGNTSKDVVLTGRFSRLYLYVEASVRNKPLTDFDSVFVMFNYKGGHLFRPDTLAVPQDETTTRLLFNASIVPYLPNLPYSSKRVPATADWLADSFNSGRSTLHFNGFLSTTQPGEIYLMALYYSCDIATPDCSIQ